MNQKTKVLAAICIVTLIAIISIGVFLKYRQRTDQPKADDVVTKLTHTDGPHTGRIHRGCEPFFDDEKIVSKGPITKVEVAHSGVIYGIRLYYGRDGQGLFHLGPGENELGRYNITRTIWEVPEGERIVRIEGRIFGNYISWLKFITNNGKSCEFGEKQGERFFVAAGPNDLPLRTISGYVNKVRHESEHNKRAIASITFHFGAP